MSSIFRPTARYIYALTDIDGSIKYIGKSKNHPRDRITQHIAEGKLGARGHKHEWLRRLRELGCRPGVRVLAIVEDSEVDAIERSAIYAFSAKYPFQLTNRYHVAILTDEEIQDAFHASSVELVNKLRAGRV